MRSHANWFFVLLFVALTGPYVLGVRPRTRKQWTYVALTIAFLLWVLALMAPLLSR